jgi:hypothetical protein
VWLTANPAGLEIGVFGNVTVVVVAAVVSDAPLSAPAVRDLLRWCSVVAVAVTTAMDASGASMG